MSAYRNTNANKWPIIIGILLIGFTSCKSKKALQIPTPESQITQEEVLAKFLTPPDYTFFSGKAKLRVSSINGSDKGTLYIRSIPDSVIWMAVKRLSVEGGRILITPDSITVINRLEKSYSKLAISELESRYGVTANFNYIQKMILGFNPSVSKADISKYEETESAYTLSAMLYDIYHEFDLEKNTGQTIGGKFNERFQVDGKWDYAEYKALTTDISLPYKRNYQIQSANNPDFDISIDFSEIELDIPKEIPFSIPKHYERIEL